MHRIQTEKERALYSYTRRLSSSLPLYIILYYIILYYIILYYIILYYIILYYIIIY